jgi:hypothetical protein
MGAYRRDPRDPQKEHVYSAQTEIAKGHPRHDLPDLPAVRDYLADLLALEGLAVRGCHRGWRYAGGDDVLVDRIHDAQDLVGETVQPVGRPAVVIVPWHDRYSHYEARRKEIVVGAPRGLPLSHRLLVVHEVSHVKFPRGKHGPKWAGTFLKQTARHLPDLAEELFAAFQKAGVRSIPQI